MIFGKPGSGKSIIFAVHCHALNCVTTRTNSIFIRLRNFEVEKPLAYPAYIRQELLQQLYSEQQNLCLTCKSGKALILLLSR